jgi:peptidoglycan hydrolase-like protein with peptidoglycan-binding domain
VKPILPGGRGSAVEDIQKRLLALGYDLGPTGVDGVFLGKTRDAVISFQNEQGLSEDGVVGTETWSTLVDSTFTLGDRMLYLRLPHFHGSDVRELQEAMNTLGFACGVADGIFGAFSEHAVREFQRNSGQPDDGIVGPDTVRSLDSLRHVWEGKDSTSPSAATTAQARRVEALDRRPVELVVTGDRAADIADRVVNLARATDDSAPIWVGGTAENTRPASIRLHLMSDATGADPEVPTVVLGDDPISALSHRFITALSAAQDGCADIEVELTTAVAEDETQRQRQAIRLLDALCVALA